MQKQKATAAKKTAPPKMMTAAKTATKTPAKATATKTAKTATPAMTDDADMTMTTGKATAPVMNIGINEKTRKGIADGLSIFLADTYTLYLKTHFFHWNVTGPMFNSLHLMFESQYNELWLSTDIIAERIRSLGFPSPGSYREFAELTSIEEAHGIPEATHMIRQLIEGHEAVARTARKLYPIVDKAADEATADLLTTRIETHEKTAWMLRALLQ